MNDITIILWITIALIAIIAIILVKLHFKGDELEKDEGSILPSSKSVNNAINVGKNILESKSNNEPSQIRPSLSPQTSQQKQNSLNLFSKSTQESNQNDDYIEPEIEVKNLNDFEYSSQNQILINYDNKVEKFQEPIKENQMDIMTQNKKDTELKDLFTIDELIKESKRKDSEREKESQKIRKDEDDTELNEIKDSIKNKTEEPLIEEIINDDKKENTIIKEDENAEETQSSASQKDINETVSTASKETEEENISISENKDITNVLLDKESEEEIISISEDNDITNVLLNQETEETPKISEPALKTPSKVNEHSDYKLGSSIDDANLFGEDEEEEDVMDLDYRKDLDKITSKIKESKIFQEVKEKLNPEVEEGPVNPDEYIRNVREYDEYEPIINETHLDYDASYEEIHNIDYDERLRQQNTRKVFDFAKNSPESELTSPSVESIKNKPERDNIKINLNNDEVVLKKGDEIIFNHLGETYSSQVYAINGDEISVRYRRKNIKIKPSDVKKIY